MRVRRFWSVTLTKGLRMREESEVMVIHEMLEKVNFVRRRMDVLEARMRSESFLERRMLGRLYKPRRGLCMNLERDVYPLCCMTAEAACLQDLLRWDCRVMTSSCPVIF